MGDFGCSLEFFPDQYSPKCRNECRPLSQAVGDCRPGFARGDHAERFSQAPDHTAQHADHVGFETAFEIVGDPHGFTVHRTFHRDGVEQEIADENSDGEDEYGRIGCHFAGCGGGKIVQIHGSGHEPVEECHDDAGRNRDENAFGREFAFFGLGFLVGESVHDDRCGDEQYPEENEGRVAFGRAEIIYHYAQYQCEPYTHGKSYRHAAEGDGCRKQDVRCVEYHAAHECREEVACVCLCKVCEETAPLRPETAQREGRQHGEEQQADDIVPVEEFIAPRAGRQFLGVAPGAPAQHGDEAKSDCQGITLNDKHNASNLRGSD